MIQKLRHALPVLGGGLRLGSGMLKISGRRRRPSDCLAAVGRNIHRGPIQTRHSVRQRHCHRSTEFVLEHPCRLHSQSSGFASSGARLGGNRLAHVRVRAVFLRRRIIDTECSAAVEPQPPKIAACHSDETQVPVDVARMMPQSSLEVWFRHVSLPVNRQASNGEIPDYVLEVSGL